MSKIAKKRAKNANSLIGKRRVGMGVLRFFEKSCRKPVQKSPTDPFLHDTRGFLGVGMIYSGFRGTKFDTVEWRLFTRVFMPSDTHFGHREAVFVTCRMCVMRVCYACGTWSV